MARDRISIYALHMNYGGVEASIATFCNMLVDNFDLEIISFYNFGNIPFDLDKRIKVKYLTSLTPNKNELKRSLISRKGFVREIVKSVKILSLRRSLVRKHIRQNNNAKILVSSRMLYHDLIGNYHHQGQVTICQEHVDHKEDKKYISKIIKRTQKCDYLMPVSEFLFNSYNNVVIPKCKYFKHSVTIPKAIDYHPSKRLISVGRLSPEKGFPDAIKLMAELVKKDAGYNLDIFGDGPERSAIENLINKLNLSNNIKLHGFRPRSVIDNYLKKSGLYLMCSHEESFGIALIESFAQGVPAIAFDSARGACEIIDGNNGMLVSNRDVGKMAELIFGFTESKLRLMSINARKTVQKFDYDIVKKDLNIFIKKIIEDKQ